MKEQFFVFGSLFDYCDAMCNDLKNKENCQFINKKIFIKNKILYFIYKVHNSGIANKFFRLPLKSIWYKYIFDVTRIIWEGGYNHFVFFDSNPHVYNAVFLKWIKENVPNSTCSLIFVNTMKTRNMRDIGYFKKHFSNIYTIDKSDSKEYGFKYVEGIHSKLNNVEIRDEYDIAFAGADKGRGTQLIDIYSKLTADGKRCRFTVIGLENAPDGIVTTKKPYQEALDDELASRCILEICVSEQNALTLRAIEAIMYDKILVTNNTNIKDCSFYNPEMMYVFENINEISIPDISKIQSYNYNGEFSPLNVLKDISQNMK